MAASDRHAEFRRALSQDFRVLTREHLPFGRCQNDITIRIAKDTGAHPDPAAFVAAASRAAGGRDASVLSAHTAEEIICVISISAATGPEATAVALAVVVDALKAGKPTRMPSR